MRFLGSLLLALSYAASPFAAGEATNYPKSITLSYQVLGAVPSSVEPLATVLYDPTSLKYKLSSWTPPSLHNLKSTTSEPTSSPLLRILLPNGSATVASLSTFDTALSQNIDLWLSQNGDGSVFSVSVSSVSPPPLSDEEQRLKRKEERFRAKGKEMPSPKPKPKPKTKKSKASPETQTEKGPVVRVNLIPVDQGPTPKLNTRKAPQVDSEGREIIQEEEQEKSFFQKYWYFFAIAAVLFMTGGGEK